MLLIDITSSHPSNDHIKSTSANDTVLKRIAINPNPKLISQLFINFTTNFFLTPTKYRVFYWMRNDWNMIDSTTLCLNPFHAIHNSACMKQHNLCFHHSFGFYWAKGTRKHFHNAIKIIWQEITRMLPRMNLLFGLVRVKNERFNRTAVKWKKTRIDEQKKIKKEKIFFCDDRKKLETGPPFSPEISWIESNSAARGISRSFTADQPVNGTSRCAPFPCK